jgi:hypothetical protein
MLCGTVIKDTALAVREPLQIAEGLLPAWGYTWQTS